MNGYPGMNSSTHNIHHNNSNNNYNNNNTIESKHHHQRTTKKTLDTHNWFQKVEDIKITIAPEREGFIFKHVNYIVESQKRSSIVLRRFSDFWWLMEILGKRYPFRTLPHLPPKKVGGRKFLVCLFLGDPQRGLTMFYSLIFFWGRVIRRSSRKGSKKAIYFFLLFVFLKKLKCPNMVVL